MAEWLGSSLQNCVYEFESRLCLVRTLTFGSGKECDVIINDQFVSTVHFEAQQDELGIWIIAGWTTNPMYLMNNSKQYPYKGIQLTPGQRVLIHPGQAIQVGRTVIPYGTI